MNLQSLSFRACCVLAGAFLTFQTLSLSAKPIRLRTGTIETDATNAAPETAKARQSTSPQSGLFLIQLSGPLAPDALAELKSLGVEPLRYVPQDAFIAKLNNASPAQILALGFVTWLGPYGPEHKIHPRLQAAARALTQTNANASLAINILLSPKANLKELAATRSLLTSIHHESHLRQGTILRGTLDSSQLSALAQSGAVLWIEAAPKRKLVDEVSSKVVGGDDGVSGTHTITQQQGFTGAGVIIAVADTGLDTGDTNTIHPDLNGRVLALKYYGALTNAADEHSHGTHVAGIIAGNPPPTGETDMDGAFYGLGVASQASLVIERIFDADGNQVIPLPSDEQLTQDAVQAGAQIGSNSWGNDVNGEYDLDAAQFDELVRDADTSTPGDQPYILEFSAGNAGSDTQSMDSPASAKNVIATGATENARLDFPIYADGDGIDVMAVFSSRGPCEDGRIKPDVVAPGAWVSSLLSAAATSQFAWEVISSDYIYMGGTSQSGPHASGAAAIFVQYYQNLHTNAMPSPALVKAALINSAVELDESYGTGPIPNNDEGWGRITLTNLIITNSLTSPRSFEFVDQTVPLTNSQTFDHHTFVRSSGQPLKITLAYTDVAGFPGAIPALVNDLDLEVTAPDGTLYRGNQFVGSDSSPNAPSPDTLNNVEAVHLSAPLPGDYLVRIRARNVVEDARLDTPAIDQDFALVVSGDISRTGVGSIILDRSAYTAPGTINVEVFDAAKAGNPIVSVTVKSTTEPAGETYRLSAAGNYGVFTGAVPTVVGTASADRKLEIHNGDAIEADYVDSLSVNRSATAVGDLVPPVLTGVSEFLDLGEITITWQTGEAANSVVHYSTNLSFNLAATNNTLTTNHLIRPPNLITGKTYFYYVTSSDVAGNVGTNNNNGAYYSFVAVATPTILLVDAYESASGSPVIPDSSYTNAIAATGITYSFWKVTQRGSPQLVDLQPFKAVMWRTTDDIINYDGTNNTLTAQQQAMIQTYLQGGGSFFMASMGILSQLGNVPFRKNVFQVGGFAQNDDPPFPCTCDEYFGVPSIQGALGDTVTGGINETLDYSQYPSFDLGFGSPIGPDFSDTFTIANSGIPIVFEPASGKTCGMRYPRIGQNSAGRVVFFSFPLDAVPDTGTAPNNRTALLQNALKFLLPGVNGIGTISLDNQTYTVPDVVVVEVGDSDLAGTGHAQVTFSTASTNQATLTLTETTTPGLFHGSLTLVKTAASAGQLFVKNGDVLIASYFDASGGSNVTTTATIDTVGPVISGVSVAPSFATATISWTTSKPADSLVQFGESQLLGRTGSDGILKTSHSISLAGLTANHTYYYDVVSRDQAGNTTVADNSGNLFTFQTLPGIKPPWRDNLDSGAPGWTVVPDPSGTDLNWTLGVPNNGLATNANSPPNAWGSNLGGDHSAFIVSTYLFSPVIDLTGANHPMLTFWANYDFSSTGNALEEGQLLISTNSSAALTSLPSLADYSSLASSGWELQDAIDLSAYAGQTIQLVWDYAGVAFGDPLNGWLIDDIQITVDNIAPGTLMITNSLSQGTFSLAGPMGATGGGLFTIISNAPLGQYTIQFGAVPYYITPAAQTNTLVAGGVLTLGGVYAFPDVNHNGISDLWEQQYFGSVATNRTQTTDTDHDGMSDYAEFIAGTDPTSALSNLKFLPTALPSNNVVHLQWTAVPGRAYRLQTSTTPSSWLPITDWTRATASPMSFSVTNSTGNHPQFYRVQVRP